MMGPPNSWERSITPQRNAQQNSASGSGIRGNSSFIGGNGDFNIGTTNTLAPTGTSSNFPPPLPPRPATTALNSNYYGGNYAGGNYGYATNPYYYGGASSFMDNYGGYNRMPYGHYYGSTAGNGDFTRLAEEQSRQAFQSVESIVQAFSSVSMMLESTLNAIHSSFRAVLGVADQFSRLKLQLSQILNTFAVIRFLRWLWRRVLILLKLRPAVGSEELWMQVAAQAPTAAEILSAHGGGKVASHWPSVVFFAFVIGGPYLIWKLVAKLVASVEDKKRWATGERNHFIAVAVYDFDAGSPAELSIRTGQRLRLAPKDLQPSVRGWILGSVDGTNIGLVPANYIKIIGKQNVGETPANSQRVPNPSVQENQIQISNSSTADLDKLFDETVAKSGSIE